MNVAMDHLNKIKEVQIMLTHVQHYSQSIKENEKLLAHFK